MATKVIKQGSDVWFFDEPTPNPFKDNIQPAREPIDEIRDDIDEGRYLLMRAASKIAGRNGEASGYLMQSIDDAVSNLYRAMDMR